MAKIVETCYIFKKIKKIFGMLKDIQNCPLSLTRSCAKPEEAAPGSADQEWARKLATNQLAFVQSY